MIRRFCTADADRVADVVRTTLRVTNAQDYEADFLEAFAQSVTAESILRRAEEGADFLVVCADACVVGCGAAAPLKGGEADEYELQTVFILPDYQGGGRGRELMAALEADACSRGARRIELSASITAEGFYRRLGYRCKNGERVLNETLGYPMEKFVRQE